MRPAGSVTIKGTGFSAPDVTVLFQVVHELLRGVGSHRHPVQFPVPSGEIHYVLLDGASRTRTNSEGPEAAILPPSAKIYMPVHVDIFLVLKFII